MEKMCVPPLFDDIFSNVRAWSFDDALVVHICAGEQCFVFDIGLSVGLEKIALTRERPVEKDAHGGHGLLQICG